MIRRFALVVLLVAAPAAAQPKDHTANTSSTRAADRRASTAILNAWVPFETNSAAIGWFARSILDDKAALLKLNPSLKVHINSTGRDAPYAETTSLAERRNRAVRSYLLGQGAAANQIIVVTTPPTDPRIGAGFAIESSSDAATSITALKQTPTIVRTKPGLEVFTLPRSLANDSVRILCSPPLIARMGVADATGVVSGSLLPRALVFVARDSAKVFTLSHDVSLVADPDRVDMTTQLPDPRCK